MSYNVTRIFDLLDYMCGNYSDSPILGCKKGNKWETITVEEFRQRANWLAVSLHRKGYQKGDKIATVSSSRFEWNLFDMALSMLGIVHVPFFLNLTIEAYQYQLEHCEAKAVIVENDHILNKVKPAVDSLKGIEIIMIEDAGDYCMYDDLLMRGKSGYDEVKKQLNGIKKSILPNDILTIIYTSGTTGKAKGVMLSHQNIITNFKDGSSRIPLEKGDKIISFLPLCHIFERMMVYLYHYLGVTTYYAQNIGTVVEDAASLEVAGFSTVPRFIEKAFDFIISQGNELKGRRKKLFFWAVSLGYQYNPDGNNGLLYSVKLAIARRFVFSKWKNIFGGKVKSIISGSAALQERLLRIFWAAGIPIQEGYGLTETSPVVTVNGFKKNNYCIGSAGVPINNVEVKIADDGEILCKGPNLMLGYFKDMDQTNPVVDKDGWFHTRDIGEIVNNRYLKIIDRKDAFFKLKSGLLISPQVLENTLKQSDFIEHAFVCGDGKEAVIAIVSPNLRYLKWWADSKKIEYDGLADLINKEEIVNKFRQEIENRNKELEDFEQIKMFKAVPDKWTSKNGMLSLTLKLKRSEIKMKYQEEINELYSTQ